VAAAAGWIHGWEAGARQGFDPLAGVRDLQMQPMPRLTLFCYGDNKKLSFLEICDKLGCDDGIINL
jgi:hypothetical protein